jgi:hypothetical protein
VLNKQAQIILKAAEQLGFTPASRTRIQVEEPGNRSDNPWADVG